MRIMISLLLFFCPLYVGADTLQKETPYKVCFTPGQNCTEVIVSAIDQAKHTILVQAYSFTSAPIAHALVSAHKRGLEVKVLLDKSQYRPRCFSVVKFLQDYKIPVLVDYRPSIAHNKVMIIDDATVITGSFNFTRAAQNKNAENVLLITNNNLAKKYVDNWHRRAAQSKEFQSGPSPFVDNIKDR